MLSLNDHLCVSIYSGLYIYFLTGSVSPIYVILNHISDFQLFQTDIPDILKLSTTLPSFFFLICLHTETIMEAVSADIHPMVNFAQTTTPGKGCHVTISSPLPHRYLSIVLFLRLTSIKALII